MNPGERASQEHQRYRLETGQWTVGQGAHGRPVEPPQTANPIGDRLRDLEQADRQRAAAFDLEGWRRERALDHHTKLYRVSDVDPVYQPVVHDFLKHAPVHRQQAVWLLRNAHHEVLLLDRAPEDAVDRGMVTNRFGAAKRAGKRDRRAGLSLIRSEASQAAAYKITSRDITRDSDTGRPDNDGHPFFLFVDGLRWAQEYDRSWLNSPQHLADRCVAWLRA